MTSIRNPSPKSPFPVPPSLPLLPFLFPSPYPLSFLTLRGVSGRLLKEGILSMTNNLSSPSSTPFLPVSLSPLAPPPLPLPLSLSPLLLSSLTLRDVSGLLLREEIQSMNSNPSPKSPFPISSRPSSHTSSPSHSLLASSRASSPSSPCEVSLVHY